MKKLIAVLLILCLVVSVAACKKQTADAPAAGSETGAGAAETLADRAAKVNRKDQFITVLTDRKSVV